MPFVRRVTSPPSLAQAALIEGIMIVDLAVTKPFAGIGAGAVAIVGEFADVTYATSVSSTGGVSTSYRPVRVNDAQDMLDKVGGFDETLGDFGKEGGNGYFFTLNRKYTDLTIVPINLASDYAVRVWRQLPPCTSATNERPIVPVVPAIVEAGREFKNSASVIARIMKRVRFTSLPVLTQAHDMSLAHVGSNAATNIVTSAGADFVAAGVQKGDALVIGVFTAANFGTYRIVSVDSATQLTVEQLDGTTFDWTLASNQPYRVHAASDFDSGAATPSELSDTSGYTIPARPLDSTIAAGTVVAPTTVPPAITASSWDPLSGLTMICHPTGALTYASMQEPNVTGSSTLDTQYVNAIASLSMDKDPANKVKVIAAARQTETIGSAIATAVEALSQRGFGRIGVLGASLDKVSIDDFISSTWPGAGAHRSGRLVLAVPGVQQLCTPAVGTATKVGDETTVTNGILDISAAAFMTSILSIIPPENNPGENTALTQSVMSEMRDYQRASSAISYSFDDYVTAKQKGVALVRFDADFGAEFQSGVTTSLVDSERAIAARRMADFIQDSIAQILKPSVKTIISASKGVSIKAAVDSFLSGLKRDGRILDFRTDITSGNTKERLAAGVWTIRTAVQTIHSADSLVIENQSDPSVVI